MSKQLDFVLEKIDSDHLARLWLFYREFFQSDDECLDFIHSALSREPTQKKKNDSFSEIKEEDEICFIPKRMLNTVERLINAARDMDLIRKGKDIFKIVYIITCIETLLFLKREKGFKGELVREFFCNYILDEDKEVIKTKFKISRSDIRFKPDEQYKPILTTTISINEFAGIVYEYRNCATHEGDYWHAMFKNRHDDIPLLISVNIDTKNFTSKKKNKEDHSYEVSLDYDEFEDIIVRACISFINNYTRIRNQ